MLLISDLKKSNLIKPAVAYTIGGNNRPMHTVADLGGGPQGPGPPPLQKYF